MRYLLLLTLLFIPTTSFAAILINEIAWMGSTESANDEWIELYNDGLSDEDVSGWEITDGANLSVPLSGVIEAGDFAVLERTDDSSAPGSAFAIYTGALSNSGGTLTLKRSDGVIEDQVAGGDSWDQVGGDNTTKDTAQRTNAGWITAVPTPGSANTTISTPTEEDEGKDETETVIKQTSDTGSKPYISLQLPDTELQLIIDSPKIVYENQSVQFDVLATGIGSRLVDSLAYTWNFGDSYQAEGKEVSHTYTYPGEYVLIVSAEFARHQAVAQQEIVVLPVQLSLARTKDGDVHIHNNAAYDVNISQYRLVGVKSVVFPNHSVIKSGGTITIPADRLEGGLESMLVLYDAQHNALANILPAKLQNTQTDSTTQKSIKLSPSVSTKSSVTRSAVALTFSAEPEVIVVDTATNTAAAATHTALPASIPRSQLPLYGFIGLLVLGVLVLYTRRI